MVQLKVMESVQGSERTFEDSHLKLYRFVNDSDEARNLFAVKCEKPNDDSADEAFASRCAIIIILVHEYFTYRLLLNLMFLHSIMASKQNY